MRKVLLFIIFLSLTVQCVNAGKEYVTSYMPNYPEQYCSFENQNRDIARLEKKIFNRTYENNTVEQRISRLERHMFGALQSGDLQNRLTKLHKANSNMKKTFFNNYNDNYYRQPIVAGSGWRSMLHSFGSGIMGGVPTGITPQMDPAYMDYFEAERNAMKLNDDGDYGDIETNHGRYKYNTQRGSSTGVTLLD